INGCYDACILRQVSEPGNDGLYWVYNKYYVRGNAYLKYLQVVNQKTGVAEGLIVFHPGEGISFLVTLHSFIDEDKIHFYSLTLDRYWNIIGHPIPRRVRSVPLKDDHSGENEVKGPRVLF